MSIELFQTALNVDIGRESDIKFVYVAMAYLADDEGSVEFTVGQLADCCGLHSRRCVVDALVKLQELELVLPQSVSGKHISTVKSYQLLVPEF